MDAIQKSYRFVNIVGSLLLITACGTTATPTGTDTLIPPTVQPSPAWTLTSQPTLTPSPTSTPVPQPTLASTPVEPVNGFPQGTDGYPWWNDTVFYEIFVRSFYDSNGDGIGDFNGITEKLDYLNDGDPATTTDLGVTGLWLMPINPSPSYHGYDVSDYYDVNPQYGTMQDFKNLLNEAHKRGIRVTIDWVLNHTSSQHPWFEQAKDPASSFHDWYRWTTDSNPGPGWRYGGSGQYYYALFWEGMPDLNYANPAVVKEMKNVVKFWLNEVGVDGFRLDAAKHIFEDGQIVENTPATHAWYKDLRKFYKGVDPQAMMVGEVWNNSSIVSSYLQGDELDLAFDFDLAKDLVFAAGAGAPSYANAVSREYSIFLPGQYATFLSNHDQDRVMSVLNDKVEAAKHAATLLLTSPGVPYLYYGEEIGMLGKKPDEDIRLPLQWANETNAGFTTGTPWRKPGSDYPSKNINDQSADPNSLLSLYRTLIQARNNHAALRVGDITLINTGNRSVFASLRVSAHEVVLVMINFSSQPVSDYALELDQGSLSGEYLIAPLLDPGTFAAPTINAQGGFENYRPLPQLPANGRFILQLQKVVQH